MKFGTKKAALVAMSLAAFFSTTVSAADIVTPGTNFGLPAGNQTLLPGDAFVSPNGRFRLTFQTDGNLVLYEGGSVLWQSNTAISPFITIQLLCPFSSPPNVGFCKPGQRFYTQTVPNRALPNRTIWQSDGNLVVYHAQNGDFTLNNANSPWDSRTQGKPGATLAVQDDGNVVIYDGNRAIWNTRTCCR